MKNLLVALIVFNSVLAWATEDTFLDLKEGSGDTIIIKELMIAPDFETNQSHYVELSNNININIEGCVLFGDSTKKVHSYEVGNEYKISQIKYEYSKEYQVYGFDIEAKSFWHIPKNIYINCYSKTNDLPLSYIQKSTKGKIEIEVNH